MMRLQISVASTAANNGMRQKLCISKSWQQQQWRLLSNATTRRDFSLRPQLSVARRQQEKWSLQSLESTAGCGGIRCCSYHTTACFERKSDSRQRQTLKRNPTSSISKFTTSTKQKSEKQSADDDAVDTSGNVLVYEAPFGALVTKLRVVSLMTGVFGSVGLPLAISLSDTVPSTTGFVALALTFGTGTIATTMAIQYVFGPYIYTVERIPIRKCHYEKKEMSDNNNQQEEGSTKETPTTFKNEAADKTTSCTGPTLYMAKSRSVFLRTIETVFDTEDVEKYTGFTLPLCNFTAKGRPLYLHTENLHDNKLRQRLEKINEKDKKKYKTSKENPDDDFL